MRPTNLLRTIIAVMASLVLTAEVLGVPLASAQTAIGDTDLLAVSPQADLSARKRLAGADRYQTMAAVVSEGFASSEWAVVASGEAFPDALAASALAGIKTCPIVTTPAMKPSSSTMEQLERMGTKNVYLVGGVGAVSTEVESALRARNISVKRVAGANRQATSTEVMKELRAAGSTADAVIIATGADFADSLSVGPYSYATQTPLVLTDASGALDEETVAAIKADSAIKRVVILGGANAVSEQVLTQLGPSYTYTRLQGSNRYETSANIAQWEASQGLAWKAPVIVSGTSFPDALSGTALAGKNRSPLLLASQAGDPTMTLVRAQLSSVETLYVVGGQSTVPDAIIDNPAGQPAPTPTTPTQTGSVPQVAVGQNHFVLDPAAKVFHLDTCDNIPVNRADSYGYSYTEVAAQGYTPCHYCLNGPATSVSTQTPTIPTTPPDTTENEPAPTTSTTPTTVEAPVRPNPDEPSLYIVNTESGKFHLPGCSHGPTKNIGEEYKSYNDLCSLGYDPCDFCLK